MLKTKRVEIDLTRSSLPSEMNGEDPHASGERIEIPIGTKFDGYTTVDTGFLGGSGGFGEVQKAIDKDNNEWAIKLFNNQLV